MVQTNCSITDWKLFITKDNQTRDLLRNNQDIFSSTITHSIFTQILLTILSIAITVLNLLLIWGIVKTNKKLSTSKKLTIYHASTNILAGLVTIPYFVFSKQFELPCYHVLIAKSTGFISVVVGTETVLAMTVLRYVTIVKPFNKAIHSGKTISMMLLIQLLIALSSGVFNATSQFAVIVYPLQCLYSGSLIIVIILLSILGNVCSMLYIRRQKSKRLTTHCRRRGSTSSGNSEPEQENNISSKRYERAIWRLLQMSIVIGLCFLPSAICYVYVGKLFLTELFTTQQLLNIFDVADLCFIPCLVSSIICPCICLAWDQQIKRYYRYVITTFTSSSKSQN